MIGAAAGLLGTAAPAAAHASVVSSTPTDGAQLNTPPTVLSFDLNEAVSLVDGSAQVIDVNGTRYPLAAAQVDAGGQRIVLELQDPLPDGAYLATARVVSADTHVVSLSIRFTVGAVTEHGDWAQADGGQSVVNRAVLLPVKTGTYLGLVLSAGLFLAGRLVWPDLLSSSRFRVFYRAGAALLALGLMGRLAVLVAEQAGGVGNTTWSSVITILDTPFGTALVIAFALSVLTVAVPPTLARTPQGLGLLHAGAAVTAVTLGGHGAATELWPLPFVVTFVHVYAIAVWLGGLAVIILVARTVPALRRWHRVAAVHVVLAVLAGAVLAFLQVRPVNALVTTSYGLTLLAKVALVVAAVVAGFLVHRSHRSEHRTRTVLVEAGIALAVIAVTSLLSSLTPAKDSYTTDVATRLDFGDAEILDVGINTVRRGTQVVTVSYPDAASRQARPEVSIEFSSADANVARLPVRMSATESGDGAAVWTSEGLIVPAPGRWKVTVRFDDGGAPKLASFYYEVL